MKVLVLGLAGALALASTAVAATTRAELTAPITAFNDAFAKGDLKAAAATYLPDVSITDVKARRLGDSLEVRARLEKGGNAAYLGTITYALEDVSGQMASAVFDTGAERQGGCRCQLRTPMLQRPDWHFGGQSTRSIGQKDRYR